MLREDKRLVETEENMSPLALQANATNSKHEKVAKLRKKTDIAPLKKKTSCKGCGQKGHWVRECPNKDKDKQKSYPDEATYFCVVKALCTKKQNRMRTSY